MFTIYIYNEWLFKCKKYVDILHTWILWVPKAKGFPGWSLQNSCSQYSQILGCLLCFFSWIYQPYLTYNLRNFNIDTQNCHCWKEIHFPRPIIFEYLYVMFRGCFTVISKGCGIVISPKSWEYIQVEACVPFMGGEITQPQNPKKNPKKPYKAAGCAMLRCSCPLLGWVKNHHYPKRGSKNDGFSPPVVVSSQLFLSMDRGSQIPLHLEKVEDIWSIMCWLTVEQLYYLLDLFLPKHDLVSDLPWFTRDLPGFQEVESHQRMEFS